MNESEINYNSQVAFQQEMSIELTILSCAKGGW